MIILNDHIHVHAVLCVCLHNVDISTRYPPASANISDDIRDDLKCGGGEVILYTFGFSITLVNQRRLYGQHIVVPMQAKCMYATVEKSTLY